MLNFKSRSIAATAAVIATFVTLTAAAGPARAESVSIPVSAADLNLASAAGAKTLDRRIQRATDLICGQADAGSRFAVMNCRAATLAAARADAETLRRSATVTLASR